MTRAKTGNTSRPNLNVRLFVWKDHKGNRTPGIGVWGRERIAGHLTSSQARILADTLHDLADQLEANGQQLTGSQ